MLDERDCTKVFAHTQNQINKAGVDETPAFEKLKLSMGELPQSWPEVAVDVPIDKRLLREFKSKKNSDAN
jgi:hypothetical protein